MELRVRPTDDLDIDIISLNMREADLMEIEATGTIDPVVSLTNCCELSKGSCYTITMDELPIAMFGVSEVELLPSFASVWLLGTNDITDSAPIAFLRLTKRILPKLISPYDMVFNVMDKRNELHIRFVKWLGFTFIREIAYGPQKLPFYEFALINKRRSHV